jgi:hypothetical protein
MTTITKWPHKVAEPKDPNSTLDYQIDWSEWLGDGESIATAVWSCADTSVALGTNSATATTATVWISGGTAGASITLTCRVTTDSAPIARVEDRSLIIKCKER